MDKWDIRFLKLAKEMASYSKDPSTQTGAVIVDYAHNIRGTGYNGFAPGVKDTEERLNNRAIKYEMVIHCEVNAAIGKNVKGCILYTWPFMSCSRCAAQMIRHGIVEVVAPYDDNPRWVESFKLATEQFNEVGIKIRLISKEDITKYILN